MIAPLVPGTVTLVGAGPGDPDLLTLGAVQALRQADVVIYDRLIPLAALDEVPADACRLDVGKVPRGHQTSQDEINRLLVDHARAGRRVVRLKGGDSFVFGRGGEEWQYCAEAGIPVRVIPGVTSAAGVPEAAGIPLTHRHLAQGFIVVAGHVPPEHPDCTIRWETVARSGLTIVVLMGLKNAPTICAQLVADGLDPETPAAAIQDGATDAAVVRRATVATLPAAVSSLKPPTILVIGAVARENFLP